jgi:hypothetical protein
VPHPDIPRVEAVRVVAEDVVVLKLGDALYAVDEAAVIGGALVMVVFTVRVYHVGRVIGREGVDEAVGGEVQLVEERIEQPAASSSSKRS